MNREKKWTPGPWVRPDDGRENIIIMPEPANIGYGHKYAVCGGGNHHANAALISAAPELVSELEEADTTICVMCKLLNPQHKDCTSCPDRESRLAALAKAYGETA